MVCGVAQVVAVSVDLRRPLFCLLFFGRVCGGRWCVFVWMEEGEKGRIRKRRTEEEEERTGRGTRETRLQPHIEKQAEDTSPNNTPTVHLLYVLAHVSAGVHVCCFCCVGR